MNSTPAGGSAAGAQPSPDAHLGTPQQRLALACAEADRLAARADQEQARLREARRARAAFKRQNEQSLALADPRQLAEAKQAAHAAYRQQTQQPADRAAMIAGTATYLSELSRLNRAARLVAGRNQSWSERLRDLDEQINRQQLVADGARIAAEGARARCVEARRALVHHDEQLAGPAAPEQDDDIDVAAWHDQPTGIEAVLDGERPAFQALVARLAEEIGLDASRLHLLLLELRQALFDRARAAAVVQLPASSRFWSQFSTADARAVAAALGVLNRGFDGRDGWLGGRVADSREMAIAISMAGHDPRTLRVKPTGAELEGLWQGATVDTVEYVRQRSPDLALETFEPLVGEHSAGLAELWDNWGRLRRLMLSPAAAA